MARNVLEVILQAVDRATGTVSKVTKSIEQQSKAMRDAGKAASLAGGVIIGALALCVREANQAAAAQMKLQEAIRGTGQAVDVSKLAAQANQLERLTGIEADVTMEAQAMLATFGLTGQQILALTPRVQNLSVMFGTDLNQAAITVGKAMLDGVGALRRVGITIDEQRYKVEGFSYLLQALDANTGDVARAMGQTFPGQIRRFGAAVSQIMETMGNTLIPALSAATEKVITLANWLGEHPGWAKFLAVGMAIAGGLLAIVGPTLILLSYLPQLVKGYTMLAIAIQTKVIPALVGMQVSLGPVNWAVIAICAALVGIGYLVYDSVRDFQRLEREAEETARTLGDTLPYAAEQGVQRVLRVSKELRDRMVTEYDRLGNGLMSALGKHYDELERRELRSLDDRRQELQRFVDDAIDEYDRLLLAQIATIDQEEYEALKVQRDRLDELRRVEKEETRTVREEEARREEASLRQRLDEAKNLDLRGEALKEYDRFKQEQEIKERERRLQQAEFERRIDEARGTDRDRLREEYSIWFARLQQEREREAKQEADLLQQIDGAQLEQDRRVKEAQDALDTFYRDRRIEAGREERDEQREAIEKEMDRIRKAANQKRQEARDTTQNRKDELQNQVRDQLDALSKQEEAVRKHYRKLKNEDNLYAEARKMIIEANQEDIVAILGKYEPYWYEKGQSFGERLVAGLESQRPAIEETVNGILGLLEKAHQEAERRAEETKKAEEEGWGAEWWQRFPFGGFQQGGYVPRTMLALLHGGEFVLPKNLVELLRSRAGRADDRPVSGPVSVTIHAQPRDRYDVARMLDDTEELVRWKWRGGLPR